LFQAGFISCFLMRRSLSCYNYEDVDQRRTRLLEKIAEEKQRESSFNGMLVAGKSNGDEGQTS